MARHKFLTAGIVVTIAVMAFLIWCGKQAGVPVSVGTAEDVALTRALTALDENNAMPRGGMVGGIGSVIDLSADQKQRIRTILDKFRPVTRPDFNGKRPSPEQWAAMRDSMKTRRDSIKNEIESVLTPGQKALLDQVRAQLKAGIVPDTLIKKSVERLTSLLTLTPDQQMQGFAILKQEMQKRLDARGKDTAFAHDSSHAWGKGMDKRHNGSFGLPAEFLNILTDAQKRNLSRKTSSWKTRSDGAQ